MKALLEDAAARAARFLTGLPSRNVAADSDALAALRLFDEAMPQLQAIG